jgi:hypothetical protein
MLNSNMLIVAMLSAVTLGVLYEEGISNECHYVEYCYAECRYAGCCNAGRPFLLGVALLNIIMLNIVTLLIAVMLNVMAPSSMMGESCVYFTKNN